jgi:hypothetical protein
MKKETIHRNLITLLMIATIVPGGFMFLILLLSHKGITKYKRYKKEKNFK